MTEVEEHYEESLEDILKAGDPTRLPTTKEMLKMLETTEMPEELKENLKNMLTGGVPQVFGSQGSILAIVFVIALFAVICKFWFYYILSNSNGPNREKDGNQETKNSFSWVKKVLLMPKSGYNFRITI